MSDYEPPRCRSVHYPTARTIHVCEECLATIVRGEVYRREAGIDSEGESYRHVMCLACEALAETFFAINPDACFGYGCLEGDALEELSNADENRMPALFGALAGGIFAMRERTDEVRGCSPR